jgi:hypothetical protein
MQFIIIPVAAQVFAPECLPGVMSAWNWVRILSSVRKTTINVLIARRQTYNSLKQSPCLVAAFLAAQCNHGRTFALYCILHGKTH